MKTKLMTLAVMCFIATATSFAQTSEKVHKIENGETIESIAEKYGVTPDDIKDANPNAGDYFFAGMSIKIPEKPVTTEDTETTVKQEPIVEDNAANAFFNNSIDLQTYRSENKSTVEPYDFNYWGFSYTSSFEEADKGAYYIEQQAFITGSNWGIEWGMGANYGLIDSDYASILFKVGAAYGYVISENMLLATSFCFDGNWHGTGEYTETVYVDSNASWGGRYVDVTRKGDNEFDWGLSLKPQLVFKTGKIRPHLGFSFNWTEATKKINVGFIVGIGF